jgi:putative hydrolase of the HAD superfamily
MDKTIKNFVFDMGKVIIRFDPETFMDRLSIFDETDRKMIREKVYGSDLWIQMDMGELDEKGMCEIVRPLFPEHLQKYLEDLIAGWCDPIETIEGMNEVVFDLKKRGYGIYLLSNASVMQKEYWPNVACSTAFDGVVVSAFEHVMKPEEKFYRILLERYGMKAEECVFIDDRKANIDAAQKLGMKGIVFDGNVEKLKAAIEELLSGENR